MPSPSSLTPSSSKLKDQDLHCCVSCAFCSGNAMHTVRTQCIVLYVGNYLNPSFGPFVEVCCFIIGYFKLLMHFGYDTFEPFPIFIYFHLFVPISPTPTFRRDPRVGVQDSHAPKIAHVVLCTPDSGTMVSMPIGGECSIE